MFRFSIDRGGTFTDIYCEIPQTINNNNNNNNSNNNNNNNPIVLKLLSEDPSNYDDAPREGIRRILNAYTKYLEKLQSNDDNNNEDFASFFQSMGRDLLHDKTSGSIKSDKVEWVRMGTTVATNALLERKGERCALVITKGMKDLLQIGNQTRPNIFDLRIERPEVLYDHDYVIEANERVLLVHDDDDDEQDKSSAPITSPPAKKAKLDKASSSSPSSSSSKRKSSSSQSQSQSYLIGVNGAKLMIEQPLDEKKLREDLQLAYNAGIRSVAIVLMHSYTYPAHENKAGEIATEIGFTHVSLSNVVMPMVRIVSRGQTATVDAYLTPKIKQYVSNFASGFDAGMRTGGKVSFMQSDGGLTSMDAFMGCRALLSGPAGGVVGFSETTYNLDTKQPVIGFDMGGTSTDVSRYGGQFEHVFETRVAGVAVQAPQLDIHTVAAGGGSRLFFKAGLLVVGPESSGAHPGPVCYRKGGYLSVTDANVALGRLIPDFFPKIFGPTEDMPLDVDASKKALAELCEEVNKFYTENGQPQACLTPDQLASGFVDVANETMCRAIRQITEAKGFDPRNHILACFGGAGPQHACAMARSLGIKKVFIHRFSGILSAYGLGLADMVEERQEPAAVELKRDTMAELHKRLDELEKIAVSALESQGFRYLDSAADAEKTKSPKKAGTKGSKKRKASTQDKDNIDDNDKNDNNNDNNDDNNNNNNNNNNADDKRKESKNTITVERYLNLRYEGTDTAMMIAEPHRNCDNKTFESSFLADYMREFGFTFSNRRLIVDNVRVRAIGRQDRVKCPPFPTRDNSNGNNEAEPAEVKEEEWHVERECSAVFDGERNDKVPVRLLKDAKQGYHCIGPAIVISDTFTLVLENGCKAVIVREGIEVDVPSNTTTSSSSSSSSEIEMQSTLLSIFAHRFMGIAEQMGRTLQRTAVSTNIKERLDFSCALFSADGSLVANAPHLPVHLGSMSDTVIFQIKELGKSWKEGEVIATNHPSCGGSHLPDITVISPVYHDGHPVFYVASRGHHADIGGITPGSMPPFSKWLSEEGAAIRSFKLVEKGRFQEEKLSEILKESRNLKDNISDLKAQVASNQKGINLMRELIGEYGFPVVEAYMTFIQDQAEQSVREALRDLLDKHRLGDVGTIRHTDYMDDGTPIALSLTINRQEGSALFDFAGTGSQTIGNCNTPRAVTKSAILYSLRCLVQSEIPLNHGCLVPIQISIPDHTILSPDEEMAVVGGNVLTSQRVTDVILSAFGVQACSQGCMNNFTFGIDGKFGYYETIAGGAGAGTNWDGASAVQVHMTNTKITDAEVLEIRYPVILREFSIRRGSGGIGKYRGGDGVVRVMEFTKAMQIGVLSERRALPPQGLNGGGNGLRGKNEWLRKGKNPIYLGGKNTVTVAPGDLIRISSPGGGGYGRIEEVRDKEKEKELEKEKEKEKGAASKVNVEHTVDF